MTEVESIKDANRVDDPPTIWKWYFGWHPRIFVTLPVFLLFTYQGLWYIWAELQDIIFFFQTAPVTWGSIFLVLIFGAILMWFVLAPIVIPFMSINWLYEINIGEHTAWRKFIYSSGIILLVILGTGIIRFFTLWILGLLG